MAQQRILLGTIGRPYGVHGLVHVTSYTADPFQLAQYAPLSDETGEQWRLAWVKAGIARLFLLSAPDAEEPVLDRSAVARLAKRRLYAARGMLPALAEDEFYLADLIDLAAFDMGGRALGRVGAVHDCGAGASLEIGRLVVPFTRAAVPEIDLRAGRILVSPPAEIEAR